MTRRSFLATTSLAAAGTAAGPWVPGAHAQAKSITIGVLYDLTGPFAAAGAVPGSIGTKIAFDMINEKGGVLGKHKIRAIEGDSQSKPDVAINEAERLLNVEKVDILLGIYSSAIAVPLAEKVDKQNRVLWVTIAIDDRVFRGRDLKYTFRAQPPGSQFGQLSARFIADYAPERFKMKPQEVKGAIIYEDGPYGSGVAASGEAELKKIGMKLVLKEGYSASTPDLASLVTKLKAARPDVLFHTGYNPDITLFLRQAKELGLRVKAIVGHGAGYGQYDKLREAFREDVDHIFNVDPVASQLLDAKKLKGNLGKIRDEFLGRYKKVTGVDQIPPHASMGFNNTWVLLTDVLPRAIQKYGGWSPEAIQKAALETDIPEGGTIQGYGVKFAGPGDNMRGQNLRASLVVMQYIGGKTQIVYPKAIQTASPVLPLPGTSPYAAR
ncbi:MAG: ABC transporter ATP-binding protein [Candidatus Rokubacteria bacterium RBG_16_73_20]|nr:MAG: ABC transporter ATP-binding protein [Candidatus Rokubacteria bacterium GWA2_73_35]OGK93772.1 MAG: ABC transporter ATP-binding protein [Candidatus Rokubacteria bacterium RBG_16_73_20]HBH04872.1 ABC transporter ATP-binding protein [Candidatus Rokubacteria bacterium]